MAVAGQVEHPELLATQEVSFRSEGAKIPAYLARPRERGRYPGVILLHDIFGVSDHARDVARRLAKDREIRVPRAQPLGPAPIRTAAPQQE